MLMFGSVLPDLVNELDSDDEVRMHSSCRQREIHFSAGIDIATMFMGQIFKSNEDHVIHS